MDNTYANVTIADIRAGIIARINAGLADGTVVYTPRIFDEDGKEIDLGRAPWPVCGACGRDYEAAENNGPLAHCSWCERHL